ncbi:hypothetical protein AADG42_03300 [Ammonicoccus fulvus]|uniref:Uncharacterized protein n=1 Tax=Ammonicoccus fulvus TaxID=3138240 RepID=A0ABZ3FLT7_9ACTN
MPTSTAAGPRLMIDHTRLLVPLSDVVPPDLVEAFDNAQRHPSPDPELMVMIAAGAPLIHRLEQLGQSEEFARESLERTLTLAADAHRSLSPQVRAQLGWPAGAETLDADGWLAAYATAGPDAWLVDLAGGLAPATLLRCCLLARPDAQAELWMPNATPHTPRWRADLGRRTKGTESVCRVLSSQFAPNPQRQAPEEA